MKYKLTNEDFSIVRKFALESAKYHKKSGRSINKVIKHITQGKLGELAYTKMYDGELSDIDLNPSIDADPGWDFIDIKSNQRIDVKTLVEGHQYVTVNLDRLKSNIYAVVMLHKDGTVTLKGSFDRSWVRKNSQPSKYYDNWYFIVK